MIARLIALAVLAPLAALAQLELDTFDGTTEHLVGAFYDLGTIGAADSLDVRFRAHDTGAAALTLQTLSIAGSGFSFVDPPSLPATVASGAFVEFHVRFTATGPGQYSSTLLVNDTAVILRASATALELDIFDGSAELPAGPLYDFGTLAAGDSRDARFRAHNIGAGPLTLQTLSMAGSGFTFVDPPSLPAVVASGFFVEFRVRFTATAPGQYNANLLVNSTTVGLRASVVATATLRYASNGSLTTVPPGATIDFGTLERGQNKQREFYLENDTSAPLTVHTVTITGDAFSGPANLTVPLTLAAGASALFQIAFAPKTSGAQQGTLTIDQGTFPLVGVSADPPLPEPAIVIDPPALSSGQQANVSIQLASTSQISDVGTLTLEFHPTINGVTDDPAVGFLVGAASRYVSLQVNPGDKMASYQGQTALAFQTGTTAGTFTFTLQLGKYSKQTQVTIAPAGIALDAVTALRRLVELDVELKGFDNSYSASQISFTFFDKNGTPFAPEKIAVDESAAFKRYFFTDSKAGGMFALRAIFPVVGGTATIAAVEVDLTNSIGIAKTQRIAFQ